MSAWVSANPFSLLSTDFQSKAAKVKLIGQKGKTAVVSKTAATSVTPKAAAAATNVSACSGTQPVARLVDVSRRNSARHERRARVRAAKKPVSEEVTSEESKGEKKSAAADVALVSISNTITHPAVTASVISELEKNALKEDGWSTVEKKQSASAMISPKAPKAQRPITTVSAIAHMPSDIGVLAASFLTDKDVAMLSCCDVHHHQLGTHSTVWRNLYKLGLVSQKGAPKLTDELTNKQWRLAYLLQRHNLYEGLCCATTGHNFFSGVLGIPISFTRNPKTNTVDYISSSMDLMSFEAIRSGKVKKDVWGNSFDLWMPLYFTKNHFERALPHIQAAIATLSQSHHFRADMILDTFPKIFNTFSVLLSDEGVAACQKTFDGFIAMHRLFLALVKKYGLAKEATRRLLTFMRNDSERVKSKCPSLGNLIAYCLIVDGVKWSDFMIPYIQECFDRHVLWSCKAYPELARPTLSQDVRAQKGFEGARVSLRLLMFQSCFQRLFCTGNLKSRSVQYDHFLTQPRHLAPVTFEKFQEKMQVVMNVDNYLKFFEVVGLKVPTPATLDQMLRNSVSRSLQKGYHSHTTDFSKIQASGTSRILSKTHAVQLSKGDLTKVTFRNTWGFQGSIRYLDSSCLLYENKQLVSTVDYSNTLFLGGGSAVMHSGDVMEANAGSHTIQLDLGTLPASITSMFFVLSAYTGTLKDILKPAVSFVNATSGDELCSYNLEAHNKQDSQTAVIMCKLYRSDLQKAWHVLAIGESCEGKASNYDPIVSTIGRLL